jgi:hypothetical protein
MAVVLLLVNTEFFRFTKSVCYSLVQRTDCETKHSAVNWVMSVLSDKQVFRNNFIVALRTMRVWTSDFLRA